MEKDTKKYLLIMIGMLVLVPSISYADLSHDNILDGMIEKYRTIASGWQPIIIRYARSLFWSLAVFEITWTGMELSLQSDSNIKQFVAVITKKIIVIGFFASVLEYSSTWVLAIINSFQTIASASNQGIGGSSGISPSDIFDTGIKIIVKVGDNLSFWKPGQSVGISIACLIIIICFALLAAFLLVALVEMYVVVNAGIILLGFGSFDKTRDFSIRYLNYVLSVGVKLFSMQLLVGIGESIIQTWIDDLNAKSWTEIVVLIGISIVLLVITKTIPEILQGVVNGANLGSSSNGLISAGSAAAGAAIGAAAATTGGGLAIREAAKMAMSQGNSGLGGVVKGTAKNLYDSAKEDIASKFSGSPGAKHGTMGGRMAGRMKESRKASSENNISGSSKSYKSPLNNFGAN